MHTSTNRINPSIAHQPQNPHNHSIPQIRPPHRHRRRRLLGPARRRGRRRLARPTGGGIARRPAQPPTTTIPTPYARRRARDAPVPPARAPALAGCVVAVGVAVREDIIRPCGGRGDYFAHRPQLAPQGRDIRHVGARGRGGGVGTVDEAGAALETVASRGRVAAAAAAADHGTDGTAFGLVLLLGGGHGGEEAAGAGRAGAGCHAGHADGRGGGLEVAGFGDAVGGVCALEGAAGGVVVGGVGAGAGWAALEAAAVVAAAGGRVGGPVVANAAELIGAAFVIVKLGVEELGEILDAVGLGVLDVLHPAEDILGGFFVFGLGGAEFLLEAEIVALGFLELADASVVGQPAVLELLASGLRTKVG